MSVSLSLFPSVFALGACRLALRRSKSSTHGMAKSRLSSTSKSCLQHQDLLAMRRRQCSSPFDSDCWISTGTTFRSIKLSSPTALHTYECCVCVCVCGDSNFHPSSLTFLLLLMLDWNTHMCILDPISWLLACLFVVLPLFTGL